LDTRSLCINTQTRSHAELTLSLNSPQPVHCSEVQSPSCVIPILSDRLPLSPVLHPSTPFCSPSSCTPPRYNDSTPFFSLCRTRPSGLCSVDRVRGQGLRRGRLRGVWTSSSRAGRVLGKKGRKEGGRQGKLTCIV
jgi:hypothetical protein